jgi:hypothetical protein
LPVDTGVASQFFRLGSEQVFEHGVNTP